MEQTCKIDTLMYLQLTNKNIDKQYVQSLFFQILFGKERTLRLREDYNLVVVSGGEISYLKFSCFIGNLDSYSLFPHFTKLA